MKLSNIVGILVFLTLGFNTIAANNALINAAKMGNLKEVQSQAQKIDVNALGDNNETAIKSAARSGNLPVVEFLLSKGANPNIASTDQYGATALIDASYRGYLAIVEVLLRAKADISIKDKSGLTALDHAKRQRQQKVADALTKALQQQTQAVQPQQPSPVQTAGVHTNSMPALPTWPSTGQSKKEERQNTFSQKVAELVKNYGEKLSIPPKPAEALRIVSYNVHNWAAPGNDAFGFQRKAEVRERELNRIVSIIKKLDPDIVVFQEARLFESINPKVNRADAFKAIGYNATEFIPGGNEEQANGPFGNLVVSKIPFKTISKSKYKNQERAFIKAVFDLSSRGKQDLVLFASHLQNANTDADRKMRLASAQELVSMMNAEGQKNILIAADFNESRAEKAPALVYLDQYIKDVFSQASVNPGFSAANGTVIDYIYARLKDLQLVGTYLDFTIFNEGKVETGSDHLPVVIDLK